MGLDDLSGWNDTMDRGGVVGGDMVSIVIDVEAVWQSD